jgi:hypothetical protein
MGRFEPARQYLFLQFVVFCSCGPITEMSEPWWLQVIPGSTEVLDAAFNDDASTVTLAFVAADGKFHLGSVDVGSPKRAVRDLGEATFSPALPFGASLTTDKVDLAIRPGTGEAWLYMSGFVYRFGAGKVEGIGVADEARTVVGTSSGSLAFLGKDTLIYANQAGVYTYPIQADALGPQFKISEERVDSGSVRQVAGVDGKIWEISTTAGGRVYTANGTVLPLGEQQFIGQPLMASPGGSAFFNTSSHNGFCIVPKNANGGATRPDSQAGKLDASPCDNLDIPLSSGLFPFRRAELSVSGRRAVLTAGTSLFIATEEQPASFSNDLEGVWCALSGASFTVKNGEVKLLQPTSGIDGQFKRVMLTGGGPIRNVELQEPSEVIKENVVRSNFDYFFKRTGNSLVVTGPVTIEQRDRSRSYQNRAGFYVKGTNETCQFLEP